MSPMRCIATEMRTWPGSRITTLYWMPLAFDSRRKYARCSCDTPKMLSPLIALVFGSHHEKLAAPGSTVAERRRTAGSEASVARWANRSSAVGAMV